MDSNALDRVRDGSGIRSSGGSTITLPAIAGWYAGERVYYFTTAITDPASPERAA